MANMKSVITVLAVLAVTTWAHESLDLDHLKTYVTDKVAYDKSTKQWHVQLACGPFPPEAPVDVFWKTPSNQLLNSTRSKKGKYVLRVPNPVEDGVYSCFLSTTYCPHMHLTSVKAGVVWVNGVEQRLRLLEARESTSQICSVQCPPSTSPPPPADEGVVRDGDYILAFRLTPSIRKSAYNAYVNVDHNDDHSLVRSVMPPGCLTVDGSQPCDRHYRSKVLDLWEQLNVQKVRMVLYQNSSEAAYFEFNAVNTNYINWFSKERVIATSYRDFFAEPKNYCSIKGDERTNLIRRFLINRNYDGCGKDAGWVIVADRDDPCRSTWNKGFSRAWPVIGYMHGQTYQLWTSSYVRFADVMAIWVKITPNGSLG